MLQTLSDALRIDQTRIDPLEPFSSYGLDSIIAVNVTRLINQTLGIDLEITLGRMSARAGKGHGRASVGGKTACEADLLFVLVDADAVEG